MLKEGDKVGRFIVEHVVGEGGMGTVYQAHDENLGRKVAIKVVTTTGDTEALARVLREARIIAALDHPNAVIIHETGEIQGEPYIVMEFVPGENLRSFVGKPDVPIGRKIRWLLDVARVLSAAHTGGIVHRDIKPENVMVRPDGKIKVLDFGIARRSAGPVDAAGPTAKALIPTITSSGGFVGTPMYTAPELLKGKAADGRSDQFSWAVLAYELLEGKAPWDAPDALGIVAAMMSEPAKPLENEAIPEEIRTVITRALSPTPAGRYGSMEDIAELLEPFAEKAAKNESIPDAVSSSKRELPKPRVPTVKGKYSTQELGQAIAIALERKAIADEAGKKYDYDDLKAAAGEVGIDETELREALTALAPVLPPAPLALGGPSAARVRAKQQLQRHAAIWASFSVFFYLIDMATAGGQWFFFPVLSWGVGVAVQAAKYYFPVDLSPQEQAIKDEAEKLRHQKVMEKLAAKRGKRGDGPKLRIAAAPEKRRLTEADIEALAEEEALNEERDNIAERKRRKR